MKCPHCTQAFHDEPNRMAIGIDADGGWVLIKRVCAACKRMVLHLENGQANEGNNQWHVKMGDVKSTLVRPKGSCRPPCPSEVPDTFAEDYREACLVLPDSAKASGALSRRCLQNILREVAKVKHSTLFDEIEEVIQSGKLPSHLSEVIDTVRTIGNFAAHPIKSKQTGQILPVEPHEAEWNLDVLEALFDFYFVQPEIIRKKKAALDQKLNEAGKKPTK